MYQKIAWIVGISWFCSVIVSCNISITTPGEEDTYLDPLSGLEWQVAKHRFNSLSEASTYCDSLKLAKKDDWRLPTIDELRTLLRGCVNTMTGGACQVSDPDCLDESCYNGYCNGCGGYVNGPAPKGGFWDAEAEKAFVPSMKSLSSYAWWCSGSLSAGHFFCVDFSSGEIIFDAGALDTHCVRTAAPLAVGDKCAEGTSFCRDNNAYSCVEEKLALTEECSKNGKICYDDPVSGAGCLERPPAPVIGLRYSNPISGFKDHRVIKDRVSMDASLSCPMRDDLDETTMTKCRESLIVDSAVSENTMTATGFAQQCCMPDWKSKYCLNFRWVLAETPTPYAPETRIKLDNIPDSGEGSWYSTCDNMKDPTLASFKAHMLTPTPDGKEYKVQIETKAVDRVTGAESDIATKVDAPNIIPNARVMVQLTWKEGLQNVAQLDRREGVAVDLDLHLVKKNGMDACGVSSGNAGLLCTAMSTPYLPIESETHDDCHFNDMGNNGKYEWTGCEGSFQTIAWHAALDLDNTWGGSDYTSPEVIDLGPINDEYPYQDGHPDVNPFTDDYLLLVNYNWCQNLVQGGDNTACQEGGADYNVHAKVDIFIDGVKAPREGKDAATLARAEFVIRPREWIVVNLINWDQSLSAPQHPMWGGDAVVANAPDTHQKVCRFMIEYCHNAPIWDAAAYETWVTDPQNTIDGTCYEYGTRQ